GAAVQPAQPLQLLRGAQAGIVVGHQPGAALPQHSPQQQLRIQAVHPLLARVPQCLCDGVGGGEGAAHGAQTPVAASSSASWSAAWALRRAATTSPRSPSMMLVSL